MRERRLAVLAAERLPQDDETIAIITCSGRASIGIGG